MASAGFSRMAAEQLYRNKLENFRDFTLNAMEHEMSAKEAIATGRHPSWIAHHRKFAKRWAQMAMESYSDAIGFASIWQEESLEMRHVCLTCKNHPALRWQCKEIAFTDEFGYNGSRNIFFLGAVADGPIHDGWPWTSYGQECPCPATDLIRAPEDAAIGAIAARRRAAWEAKTRDAPRDMGEPGAGQRVGI